MRNWKNLTYVFVFIYLFIHLAALGLSCDMWNLVPWPGSEIGSPALGAWSLSYWSTREFCEYVNFIIKERNREKIRMPNLF